MKLFVLAFLLISSTTADEALLTGTFERLEFDSLSNTYACQEYVNLVKLDKDSNVVFSYTFPYLLQILINRNDDVFVIANFDGGPDGTDATTGSLWRMKAYSNDIELLFNFAKVPYPFPNNYFIDKGDNIFLNTRNGVSLFRSRKSATVPLAITNLNGYNYESYTEDDDGNVYLSSTLTQPNSIAVITKSAKQKLVPDAIFYPVSEKSLINGLTFWNSYVIFVDQNHVKRLRKDLFEPLQTEVIISQYNTTYTIFNGQSNRLIIISKEESSRRCQAHFLNLDDEVVTTENDIDCSILSYKRNSFAFKKDGTAFFIYYNIYPYVGVLNHNETKFNNMYRFEEAIFSVGTDDYDNLWILTFDSRGALHVVPRGSTNLTTVYESTVAPIDRSVMKFKKETGEIFVGADNGLFRFTNAFGP